MNRFSKGFLAGLAATVVLSVLMVAKGMMGVEELINWEWIQVGGRADSNLKCDKAQPVRCRPNGTPLLARHAG